MSPSKKKAAKSTTKKSNPKAKSAKRQTKKSKTKKAAPKKKSKPTSATAKKTTAKKAAKAPSSPKSKTTAKKAAVKSPAKKAAKAPAKPTTPKKTAAKTPSKKLDPVLAQTKTTTALAKAPKPKSKAKATRSSKRARPKKPVTPIGPRHPKFGYKWVCFGCGAKFYDLGKDDAICPKCETNQRNRPPQDAKPVVETPKQKVVRPMAQLLDDEEPAVNREEDVRARQANPAHNEMFDDVESDAAGLDIDDADLADAAQEPPEIDAL